MGFRSATVLLIVAVALVAFRDGIAARASTSRPNIVLFVADDVGYGDLSCYGHPTTVTPNLDKLAAGGMRFTQTYSGAPVCSASRASILTGRLPVRNGVYTRWDYPGDLVFRVFMPNSGGGLPLSEKTIAAMLKDHGYKSALIGKWHLGHKDVLPTDHGFDYFYGLPYSHEEGCPPGLGIPCAHEWQHIFPPMPLMQGKEIIEQPVNLTAAVQRYTEEAISFMNATHNAGDSFFVEVAYEENHVPLFASAPFQNQTLRGLYGDSLLEMDDSIGRVVAAIPDPENTLVLFASDNGAWTIQGLNGGWNGPFRGEKGSTWEGGVRGPFIAHWPGVVPAGVTMQAQASLMDIFPTVLELAGVPLPTDRDIDGKSLVDVLKGKTQSSPHEEIFIWRDHTLYATRKGAFKAHFITRNGFGEEPPVVHDPPLLFNVAQDPSEAFPLNITADPTLQLVLSDILAASEAHKATVVPFTPAQLDILDEDVMPCCDRSTNCFCEMGDGDSNLAGPFGADGRDVHVNSVLKQQRP